MLGDAAGGSGLRARERQVHGGAFAGSDKFPTKEIAHGVHAAAAEGGPTRDTAMGVVRWIPKGCTGWSTMATA